MSDNNRLPKRGRKSKKEKLENLSTFFLACECKPNSEIWSALDPFAYDVKPAFIFGSLGVLSYVGDEPTSCAIIDNSNESAPLYGYIATITHAGTQLLLDRVKGYYGVGAFNYHEKKIVQAFTDVKKAQHAWGYILSEYVLDSYETLEIIEGGLNIENDEQLIELMERIETGDE